VALDVIRAAWPIFLGVWIVGVLVWIAWNGRGFLEQRREEVKQGDWLMALGFIALGFASALWWAAAALTVLFFLVVVITWLVYKSGVGG
jgi:hypothetical protein